MSPLQSADGLRNCLNITNVRRHYIHLGLAEERKGKAVTSLLLFQRASGDKFKLAGVNCLCFYPHTAHYYFLPIYLFIIVSHSLYLVFVVIRLLFIFFLLLPCKWFPVNKLIGNVTSQRYIYCYHLQCRTEKTILGLLGVPCAILLKNFVCWKRSKFRRKKFL